ncbi:hypothetical protein A3J90_08890 [candidate division WOR-1 bacterium RIFOXYC2_FULL_37_10]|uniref:DUF3006 domain-containing protein n=1 Tax=candidate division WOR-1 bacterium RIFOXYB2_FULL_37_13 TaxID=1802579 RepID=A0A1F4SUU5_UNCSA|nr:MAG: hypothetical protein A2246_03445 [candidate division WOR-1 bacterium RIFOXYA2_FULL_37_7]OGC24205.1 MAG: hypothetical protein A2310_06640 [candidate division WOR-1 bacterium RIFOXYB2_FULL_37_13]OGC36568.1 MAG: hypothetical protein A3J90_08890 [candidate division WOR-1 bacterium RIFOXYC2_FULL_37_10]
MKQEIKFKAIVDRIEGDKGVLLLGEEQDDSVDFPKNFLPDIKEGDILNFKISVKSRKTKEAKDKVKEMIEKLKAEN